MASKENGIDESTVIIDEIESNLANILTKKREVVEREYQEHVRREKEESDRKISRLEEEFSNDKGLLLQFRSTVSEYERTRQGIRSEVQSRLEKAVKYQKEIERLTGLTMDELNKVDELSTKLADLRRSSDERAAELRARIQKRFGLILEGKESPSPAETLPSEIRPERSAEPARPLEPARPVPPAPPAPAPHAAPAVFIPEPPRGDEFRTPPAREPEPPRAFVPAPHFVPERPASERLAAEERIAAFRAPEPASEMIPDLELELRKLKRIKQLLENDGKRDAEPVQNPVFTDPALGRHLNPDLPPLPEEPAPPSPASIPEPAADMKMPEINQIIEEFAKRPPEPVPLRPEPAPVPPRREDRPAPKNGLSFQAVFEMLEQYRKTEALDDANEISYFQKGGKTILDGESIIRSMGQISDNAKKIAAKLAQAGSAKDQFFLKQELVNQQEILRKILLRGIRMCENESAVLPAFTAEAMDVSALRGILEQLTQGNWSNVESLAAFDGRLAQLRETFYRLITPPAYYLRSILDELNA